MPFLTRPHFEDRQIVQYSDESIRLSGTSYIAATVLDFTGTTTGETAVTINSLTGYLNGQRLSGLVVEPAKLKLSGTTGTTTQNVTGFVLQSIDPYGSVEWAPLSGVSWSVSACTSPLYVSTIEACPNPTDPVYITAGNVQFGATPSLIADITNTRLGVGIGLPTERLHVSGGDMLVETSNGKFYTDIDSTIGPAVRLSGNSTDLITLGVSDVGIQGMSIGTRGFSEASYPGYGKQGDGFIYSSAEQNGLNIISQDGTNKEDYIRFYSGKDANGTTPDIHIQGSGTTKGNVGINTIIPSEKLHVEGSVRIVDGTEQNGYVLTSDADGVGTWQYNSTGFSGNTSASCITDLYVSNIYGCSPITIHDSVQHTGSTASGTKSVAFGLDNVTNSDNSAILSGNDNNIDSSDNSTIGSGKFNTITGGTDNFIATGGSSPLAFGNKILGSFRSFIGGGRVNKILISDSFIGGGQGNELNGGTISFIGGGGVNKLNGNSSASSIVGGQGNTVDIGKYSFIGGGIANSMIDSERSIIGGGSSNNLNNSPNSSIVGGQENTLSGSTHSFIGGGQDNTINENSTLSSIVGGRDNGVEGEYSFIGNGENNSVSGRGSWNTVINGQSNDLSLDPSSNYNTVVGNSHSITGTSLVANSILGGESSGIYTLSGLDPNNSTILGGRINSIYGSTGASIIGGDNNLIYGEDTNASIIGGQNNTLSGAAQSTIVGGSGILGVSTNTVYTPNLTVRGDYVLHSDSVLEVGDVPGSLESTMKGSYTEFNHELTTANVLSNSNNSGFTSVIIGDLSTYPTKKSYGFISYYNSQFTRTGTPPVGTDFNRGKLFLKASDDTVGMVINPRAGDPTAPLWFEMNGASVMKLQGDGFGKATLGIAMSQDGTETASANLQIGGTGTTGTFKYRDGNQQSGYVLTSDVDGNATWQVSTASGGTSGGITIDPYQDEGNVNSITWDVSGTSTNYEATLTGATTLDLTNVRNGDYGTIIMEQDGVGSHTLALGTVNGGAGTHKVVNGGGGTIVLTGTANSIDLLTFTYNGSTMWWSVGYNYT